MGAKQSAPSTNNNSSQRDQAGPSRPEVMGSSDAGRSSSNLGLYALRQRNEANDSNSTPESLRQRARSLSHVYNGSSSGRSVEIPLGHGSVEISSSPDSDANVQVAVPVGCVYAAHSLPVQLVSFQNIKCPVCSKAVPADDVECHLVMCLTKPRIVYNEDTLCENKGECVICLEDLCLGDTIARLPCLCIYHKPCIDAWFKVNRSCPEHPSD